MGDINKERADAVRSAWKNERALVREGKGTRDWSQRQQIGMIRKGQVSGFDGHHMQSVKTHHNQAGNPKNIQFLNKNEHIQGAHKGNTKNPTNGYYNPQTKTMHGFGNNNPQVPQINLSNPLSQNQINSAVKREQYFQNRVSHDRAFANQWRQANGYSPMFGQKNQLKASQSSANKGIDSIRSQASRVHASLSTQRTSQNKGVEAVRQKAEAKSIVQSSKSTNRGISSYQSRASGQTGSSPKSNLSGTSKGTSVSGSKSGGSSTGGQSSGSGQGR